MYLSYAGDQSIPKYVSPQTFCSSSLMWFIKTLTTYNEHSTSKENIETCSLVSGDSVRFSMYVVMRTSWYIIMLLIKVDLVPPDVVCFTQKKEPSSAYLGKETNMTDSFNMENITSVTITSVTPSLPSLLLPSF